MEIIDKIRGSLMGVVDPEVGVNIVDLGLVYRIEVKPGLVEVDLGVTSPTCPLGPYLAQQVQETIGHLFPELGEVRVDVKMDIPWSQERMSPEAKQQLGW